MNHLSRLVQVFCIVLITVSFAYGLGVYGSVLRHHIDFEPGYTDESTYTISNREGYTSNYNIRPQVRYGADLSPYITITPERIEDIPDGGHASFKVRIELPESLDVPGESLTWVKVEIEPTQPGALAAYPSIALSYYVFVLYPYKYIEWTFSAPNMNVNETKDFTISFQNLGEPTIDEAYADYTFINKETNQTIRQLRTNIETSIESRQERAIRAAFDSKGLAPGEYRVIADFHWDGNKSTTQSDFRIGTKNVKITNFTKLFEIDSINKFDINIESGWNTPINDIYAEITIRDLETQAERRKFKSLNTELRAWESKILDAYFDTKGLEKKEYKAEILLKYEGTTTYTEGIIRVDEDINAVTVDEIPGQVTFKSVFRSLGAAVASIEMIHILILLLIIFLIINMFLVLSMFKNRKKKEPQEKIDPAVIEHVRELKKKYNDSYIKEKMIKKGWSEDKVEKVLRQAKK
ncbi:hypothetical protein JXC34_07065 [Candidatus Woesearchaeota archaeon]|nr:hypothetical protein [Candidatus Woesearchaeota archaeon]